MFRVPFPPRAAAAALALLLPLAAAPGDAQVHRRPDGDAPRARADTGGGPATPGAIARDARSLARRIGLWGSLGLGRGQAGLSCPSCTGDRPTAYALQAQLGGQVTARFHVGVEAWTWLDVFGGGVDRTASGAQLLGRFYPVAGSGLFLGGGAGMSTYALDDGELTFAARAPTLSFAVGWDMPWRGVVVSPTVTAFASTGGPLESDATGNAIAENARLGVLRTSVAVTWF